MSDSTQQEKIMSDFKDAFSFQGDEYAHWTKKKFNDQLCVHLTQVAHLFFAQKYGNVKKGKFWEEAADLLLILKEILRREGKLNIVAKQHKAFKIRPTTRRR